MRSCSGSADRTTSAAWCSMCLIAPTLRSLFLSQAVVEVQPGGRHAAEDHLPRGAGVSLDFPGLRSLQGAVLMGPELLGRLHVPPHASSSPPPRVLQANAKNCAVFLEERRLVTNMAIAGENRRRLAVRRRRRGSASGCVAH